MMTFNLMIPEIGKKTSAKDSIIGVLIENWPLSLKEIYHYAKKQFGFSGSYQAIFKGANELLKGKIITHINKKYEINISWIKQLQSFTDIVETNYYTEKKTKDSLNKKRENVILLNFSSVFDLEKYLYYFIKNELKKMKNEEVFYEMNNLWKVLFYYRAEYNYYTKLMLLGHKFYFLVGGKSSIENSSKEFYKKIGIKIKKIKENTPTDSIVFGDYYIQIFLPEKIKEKIENLLKKGSPLALLKVLDEEIEAKIIIHKDKNLSQGIIEKLKKKFG